MPLVFSCDDPLFPEDLPTDICGISVVRWGLTGALCGLLLGVQLYLQHRWKYRCHKTLLTFHNLRSCLVLLLLAINSLELARALLPEPANYNNNSNNNNKSNNNNYGNNSGNYVNNGSGYGNNTAGSGGGSALNLSFPDFILNHLYQPQQQQQQQPFYQPEQQLLYQQQQHQQEEEGNEVIVVVGSSALLNGVLAIVFTLVLMSFHRVVELKNTVEFLYVSAAVEFLISMLRVYELAEITYDRSMFELEPCLQAFSAICLLSLGAADGSTVYKERYRPVYFEDYEKIGYKHTLATFYSKAVFWWLTPLLWFGYKEPLEPEDLGQLRVEDRARAYYDRFLLIYKTAKMQESDPPSSLWLCYVLSSWRMFTLGGALKLLGDLCALIGPLAIQQIVQYIEGMYAAVPGMQQQHAHQSQGFANGQNRSLRSTGSITSVNPYNSNNYNNNNIYNGLRDSYNEIANGDDAVAHALRGADVTIYYASWSDLVSNGWAIAWIVLLAALAQGGLSQASTHILNMTGIRIKTSLQGLIYRKTLLLSTSCIDKGGEKSNNERGSNSNNEMGSNINNDKSGNNNDRGHNCKASDDAEGVQKTKGQEQQPLDESTKSTTAGSRSPASDGDSVGNGAGSTDVGAITNLMTEDTLNVMSFFWIAHYVWAIPLKIGVVMYLLYLKLGVSAIIGSFVCILTLTPLQFLIGKAMSDNTEKVAKFTDERLRKIHDTFCGIKLIKLNAWDDVFLKKIRAARHKELHYLNKDSVYWTLMTILTHVSSVLISFVTLAVFVRLEGGGDFGAQFTASRLFSALALFQQLTVPLLIFPITVPIIISAVVSTRRLDRFLLCPEVKKEFQGIRNMARILCKSDASLDMYEREATAAMTMTTPSPPEDSSAPEAKENALNERLRLTLRVAPLAVSEPQSPIKSLDAPPLFALQPSSPSPPATPAASCPSLSPSSLLAPPKPEGDDCTECKRRVLLRNTPYVLIRPPSVRLPSLSRSLTHQLRGRYRDALLLKMPEGVAVSLRQACFAWDPRSMERRLSVDEIDVPKGRLTVVVGKNGSGKSSLLAALLMEMPHVSGDLIWNKTSTFAYVPQQPWLLNASIRQNILFGEDFRPKRYEFVLEACALKPDIDLMPERDFTVIGERGLNLSGGQRQRVAIARALYSSANVVLMDDPLSSLDNEVGRHIFEQSIRRMLLKANRTVILVTQQLSLVRQADYLVVMKDGRVQAAGSYEDIEAEHSEIVKTWTRIIVRAQEREQQNSAAGRTARERWKLFKNVSKLGLMRSVSLTSATSSVDGAAAAADEAATDNDILPATLPRMAAAHSQPFPLTRKRSSVYGSRHLIYDVPLPIDECGAEDVIFRRQRHRRRTVSSRSSSGSSDFRRSLLTASCSSVTHNNNEGGECGRGPTTTTTTESPSPIAAVDDGRQQRGQSWQTPSRCLHQKAPRNATSTPASLLATTRPPFEDSHWAASMAACADGAEVAEEGRLQTMGSFQQFMRRMSSRRSNLTKGTRLHHRPLSATNSILEISEESTTSLPSIELGSVATETSSWIANIEDEEPVSDAHIDYQDSLRPPQVEADAEVEPGQLATKANGWAPSSSSTSPRRGGASPADVERKYGKIPAQIYLLYLRASGYPMVLAFFVTALVLQGLRVYTDVWLQHWTDNVGDPASTTTATTQSRDPEREATAGAGTTGHEVTYYFHVYAAISCVCILMALLSTPAGQMAGCNARRNLHDQLLSAIMRKSLHFFQVTPLGRIMNRFGNDMAIIDKKIAATSQRLLQFTLLCLCAVLINVSITPWFVLLTLPICAAYYAIQKFYRCSSRELQRIENFTNTPVISHLSETIQGVTTIRAYNQEARFTEILFRRLEANTIAFTILNTSNRWLGISLDYLGGVIVFVAIVTALLAATISCRNSAASYEPPTNNDGHSGLGDTSTPSPSPSLVGLAINYTLLVPIYLNWVVKLLADMEMYVGSVERIAYYAEAPPVDGPQAANESRTGAAATTTHETPVTIDHDDADDGIDVGHVNDDDDDEDDGEFNGSLAAVDGPGADVRVADRDDGIEKFAGADKTAVDKADAVGAATTTTAATTATRRPPSRWQRNEVERRASVRRLVNGVRYKTVPISWPQRGDISFEHVSLRYEGRPKDVITDLTLRIPAGQRIGICGRTGSGKSSLALSLFGVLQTTAGRILIDDVDITQVHPDEIRSRLSIIPQDVHLFNATIRENLDPPGYYSDLALWNCLEVAQLKEFVSNAMPEGLDTEILDGGANLSAGHRQLFCLARAILRGSVCLVLDEATSSLDSSTEQQLLDTAHRAFQGRTILTIAHRLSTILNYDRIIVLENGRVVEDGSPQELQRRSDGVFHALLHSGRPLSVGSDSGLQEYMRVQEDVREEDDDDDNDNDSHKDDDVRQSRENRAAEEEAKSAGHSLS